MFISKKQSKSSCNSTRYSSKKAQNQTSLLYSHRPHDTGYESLRNSGEKVLKLRGNSKPGGIKMVSQDKSNASIDKLTKHDRKYSNLEITHNKGYLTNSKQSSTSINFYKELNKPKKQSSNPNSSISINITGSFSKANKQNKNPIEYHEPQRKKSSHKGLALTKKCSDESSYFLEGYQKYNQNYSVKPKSARGEKPLHQNYLYLNLNEISMKQKEEQKRKISFDFQPYLAKSKDVFEKKKDEIQKNYSSQRNSISSFYQTGTSSMRQSKEQLTISNNYATIKLDKKPVENSKKLQLKQSSKLNISKSKEQFYEKPSTHSKTPSTSQMFTFDKCDIDKFYMQNQELKSHRVNNYVTPASEFIEKNHKRILSILEKSSGSKFFDEKTNEKDKGKFECKIKNENYESGKKTQNQASKQPKKITQLIKYSPNSFSYDYVVGKGGFGKVWKVHCKRTNQVYALKQMSKALVISKKSVPSVMNQQQLLKNLKNPFLVNMIQSFQTRQNLYLLMDYLSGGDLRHHLAVKKHFTEAETKFLMICILLGLKYLHQNNIIHRDIKPENIVLDEKGYARITDLGVARKWRENNSCDTSGTPGYMAPQVLCRQDHSYPVDYFAAGVICYELMLRKRPYYGRSRKEIRDEVLAKQVQIKRHQIPEGWTLEGADFINRMIQRKPSNRLGYNGIEQIFNHPWLRNVPLHKFEQRRIQSPYIPQKINKQQNDFLNYTSSQQTQIKQLIAQNQIMLRQKDVQSLFQGYENY